ncbi:uncharacterized protein si:ch211-149e23.4 [Thalassophryne amazonica]|uniref:uncharacterized protein si:ch211-149e23.4 n=1 Tax=Thalassophryne amazonica TaxID=390379 RepID=UPI001471A628|nr:uncharacterized protein si:ch211-149e23.4 [Thalassophryne amazonica]
MYCTGLPSVVSLSDTIMGRFRLLLLGLILNVAHCVEILGDEQVIEITANVTAILGEDVYLSCRYLGEGTITNAQWKRQIDSKIRAKRITGFANDKPFKRDVDFSIPDSPTNLTVKMRVSSVAVEGEYTCEFASEDAAFTDKLFLTVLARPDIRVLVNSETINGTHYQLVSCSALCGRPVPQISWLIGSLPLSNYPFTAQMSHIIHPNGTTSLSSTLHFPTHLQDEDQVTCVVHHPTLSEPTLTTVRVDTFVRPNVSIQAEMIQREGNDVWVVSCIASGGRPASDISLALTADEELQEEEDVGSDIHIRSFHFRASAYEGRNVTCMFDHPKFTQRESRVLTLPSFYLTAGKLFHWKLENSSVDVRATESLELQEGQRDAVIDLNITGNVPHYTVTCTKDDGPLPEGVEVFGSNLTVPGPADSQHAGLYECVASYHQHKAMLQFIITLKPTQPVPPTIRVALHNEDGQTVIECSAADAVPAANVSWLLPQGVSGVSRFNFTSHNGSHSVRGVLLLLACSPWELAVECVINHPAFEKPESRSVTLSRCAQPNITMSSSTEWRGGEEYTLVNCSVDSAAPAATITWHTGNNDSSTSYLKETSTLLQLHAEGLVSVRSSVHFLSSLYSDQNLTCTVKHQSLEAPEQRTVQILQHRAPMLRVFIVRQQDSPLWLAVCDYQGEAGRTNLTWVLHQNTKAQRYLPSVYKGHTQTSRITYQFPLALHEGHNLSCVHQCEHGITEKRTIHIPRYYISSVRVLNHTTPLHSHYGGEPITHRLTLKENQHKQRIMLQVYGNVPEYSLKCQRSDGSSVRMEGVTLIFETELTERDEGLYMCQASFYHHTAAVHIQVELMSEEKHFVLMALICFSSASAIALIAVVVLWVFCKSKTDRNHHKDSLSALTALMQDPGSPEVKKPTLLGQEYAQLTNYSIVIDLKSTV